MYVCVERGGGGRELKKDGGHKTYWVGVEACQLACFFFFFF